MKNVASAEHTRLRRAQQQAYFAWQAAPAGQSAEALALYEAASAALQRFNARGSMKEEF